MPIELSGLMNLLITHTHTPSIMLQLESRSHMLIRAEGAIAASLLVVIAKVPYEPENN